MLQTSSSVTSFTLNDIEDIAFWTDSKIIYSSPINKSIITKVIISYYINSIIVPNYYFLLDLFSFKR